MANEIVKDAKIIIILDDETFEFTHDDPNENINELAQAKDIDVPFSCMAGVCSSCRARLLEGSVSMEEAHSLTEEEIEEGFVLTCQARPTSDKVVLSFDDL